MAESESESESVAVAGVSGYYGSLPARPEGPPRAATAATRDPIPEARSQNSVSEAVAVAETGGRGRDRVGPAFSVAVAVCSRLRRKFPERPAGPPRAAEGCDPMPEARSQNSVAETETVGRVHKIMRGHT